MERGSLEGGASRRQARKRGGGGVWALRAALISLHRICLLWLLYFTVGVRGVFCKGVDLGC